MDRNALLRSLSACPAFSGKIKPFSHVLKYQKGHEKAACCSPSSRAGWSHKSRALCHAAHRAFMMNHRRPLVPLQQIGPCSSRCGLRKIASKALTSLPVLYTECPNIHANAYHVQKRHMLSRIASRHYSIRNGLNQFEFYYSTRSLAKRLVLSQLTLKH